MEMVAQPPRSAFPWYLTGSSLWLAGMSLQGFLITWLLVGELQAPADQVGLGRALMHLPGIAVLVLGGVIADRSDGRLLLLRLHLLIALPPVLLALCLGVANLSVALVIGFGICLSVLQAISDPARQAMLNRVTLIDLQRTVTITSLTTSLVGLGAIWLGGRLEQLGIVSVLLLQALLFVAGGFAMQRLPALPVRVDPGRPDLLGGLKACLKLPLLRDLIGLSFLGSLFNAGAYVLVLPYIVTQVYQGDAAFFAMVVMLVTLGGISANLVLLRFMPLLRPGRLFLLLQFAMMLILALLLLRPAVWLFLLLMTAWGLSMGSISTLVRSIVQEQAPLRSRGQILTLLTLSFMLASPLSAWSLGQVIARTSPLGALLAGILLAALIFLLGRFYTGLWGYRSGATGTV